MINNSQFPLKVLLWISSLTAKHYIIRVYIEPSRVLPVGQPTNIKGSKWSKRGQRKRKQTSGLESKNIFQSTLSNFLKRFFVYSLYYEEHVAVGFCLNLILSLERIKELCLEPSSMNTYL